MIGTANTVSTYEGGDPPCWSHLLEDTREDIVDRDDIEVLVRNFYRDAAMDDVLGPVFEAAHVNWNAHIATLIDFWAWQLLGEPGYDGQPLRAHEPVHARTPLTHSHYERWVELFCDTIDASFHGSQAEIAKGRGSRWRQPWNAFCRVYQPSERHRSNQSGGAVIEPAEKGSRSAVHEVHKRCTGFANTERYCSAPERLHGLEQQATAH